MDEQVDLQAVIDVLAERLKQAEVNTAYLTALVNDKNARISALEKELIDNMDADKDAK